MNKRTVGGNKEEAAAAYLTKQGVRITERNFRVRQGEIDLIGYDGGSLVFFEVKYRRSEAYGRAAEAVDYRKQLQISKVALYYRSFRKIRPDISIRYDVVAITGEKIEWIKNAFPDRAGGF